MVFEFLQTRLRLRTYHKDSYMAHRRERLGWEGRYRRTASPNSQGGGGVSLPPPVVIPEDLGIPLATRPDMTRVERVEEIKKVEMEGRQSEISGWESQRTLTGSQSSIIFTSDELKKLRRQREASRQQLALSGKKVPPDVAPKPSGRPYHLSSSHLASHAPLPPPPRVLQSSKSTPSLNLPGLCTPVDQPVPARLPPDAPMPAVPPVTPEKKLQTSSLSFQTAARWKKSLDSLDPCGVPLFDRSVSSVSDGERQRYGRMAELDPSSHTHSNSDSGLSSMSGRTNTTSPVSTVSTSSGGSSRTSLRSASIVSTCTVADQHSPDSSSSGSPPDSFSRLSGKHMKELSADSGTGTLKKQGRRKFQEEIECEELYQEVVKQLPQNNRIHSLFISTPEHKTRADYIEGILELDDESGDSPRNRRNLSPSLLRTKIEQLRETEKRNNAGREESKTQPVQLDQSKKREELLQKIQRKLGVLREELTALRHETALNEEVGQAVVGRLAVAATAAEMDKFKLHIAEIDKITSLLLGLSGRLARAENSLASLSPDVSPDEKKLLEGKRNKLAEQLDEAKRLKENIDRRSATVSSYLERYVGQDTINMYNTFVKTKSRLILEIREIDEKVKLGDEQMLALKDSIFVAR